jgi:bacteriocin-like protein
MRELSINELDAVSGGLNLELGGGFGIGETPTVGGIGATWGHSFSNGWSLSAGFGRGDTRGLEIRYDFE